MVAILLYFVASNPDVTSWTPALMKLKLESVVSVIDLAYNFCWDFMIGTPFSVRTGRKTIDLGEQQS